MAQSAGNGYVDACSVAFNYSGGLTNIADGIMVVGAIDSTGKDVRKPHGGYGFVNAPYAGNEAGSNYGKCVEAWAPGNNVLSTWGLTTSPYTEDATTIYTGYVNLSGTSMAAPHIAAMALYLAETTTKNAGQVESAIRSYFYNTGNVDVNGYPVRIPELP